MHIESQDPQIVAEWLKWHPKRYFLGCIAGGFASFVAMKVAMILSVHGHREITYPAKLFATLLHGFEATSISAPKEVILSGYVLFTALSIFWALVFSHFVTSKNWFHQFFMGLVWGFLSWVFLWNLFGQSFITIAYANVSSISALAVCLAYGISLSSLSILDKIFLKR